MPAPELLHVPADLPCSPPGSFPLPLVAPCYADEQTTQLTHWHAVSFALSAYMHCSESTAALT